MNTKQLQYVLTLANEGSFSKAADVLNITQPSLSQYIKKIEREVGAELFDRTNGDVRLTDAGRAYIDIGRKMLDLKHQLEEQLSDIAVFKSGTISIGISAHRSVALMPSVVYAFKNLYPGITLQIIEKKRHELIEAAVHLLHCLIRSWSKEELYTAVLSTRAFKQFIFGRILSSKETESDEAGVVIDYFSCEDEGRLFFEGGDIFDSLQPIAA